MKPHALQASNENHRAARRECLCYKDAHADHRVHPQRQRGPPRRRHRAPGRRDPRDARRPPARPLVGCVAQPLGVHAGRRRAPRSKRRPSRSSRSPPTRSICGSTSGEHPRLGAVDVVPFVPDRGRHDGRLRRARQGRRRRRRRSLRRPRLPVRGGVGQPGAQEPRGHPPRRVRGAGGEDGVAGLGARLRTGGAAPVGRRVGRSARACRSSPTTSTCNTDRLDVAQEDRRGDPPQQRRAALRQGDGRQARGPQPRAGVDEPDQLREDADLPRLRDGEARGRPLRRRDPRERDRRPGAVGGAACSRPSSTCSWSGSPRSRCWRRSCGTSRRRFPHTSVSSASGFSARAGAMPKPRILR